MILKLSKERGMRLIPSPTYILPLPKGGGGLRRGRGNSYFVF